MPEALTAAEWTVMDALWRKSPLTHSELIAVLGDSVNWKYTTYGTYLQILCKKGFVQAQRRGRDKLYAPAVSREACIEMEGREILKKVRPDAVKSLVISMLGQAELSGEDHAELQRLFESLSEKEARP